MSNMIINGMDKDWGTLIITYGLSEEQISEVEASVPNKRCEVYKAECFSDIIGFPQMASIVIWNLLTDEDKELLVDYFGEIAPFSETVVLIGEVDVPKGMRKDFVIYATYEEFSAKAKYILLNALKQNEKSINYSRIVSNTLMILHKIKQKPYISSRELAEEYELNVRTVQRYINTLQVAGEFIEYDTRKKGWYLMDGKSVLLGDAFD